MIFLGFGAAPAAAQAVHLKVPNDLTIVAPYEPTGAIVAQISAFYTFTPGPRVVVPQGGDWSLDWIGDDRLPAGHYEGKMNAIWMLVSAEDDGSIQYGYAEAVFVSPGQGTMVDNPIWTTFYYTPPTCRLEWDMHILGTGVYAGLSGDGVAWVEFAC